MSYKLVALDLDGTLLNDQKKISGFSMDTLRALRKKNIEVVVATGRRYRFAKELFTGCGLPVTILCSGGTSVRNTGNDVKIMSQYLDKELFYDIVGAGRECSLRPVLHVDRYEEGCDLLTELAWDAPCYGSYITEDLKECRAVGDFLDCPADGVLLMCYMGGESQLENFRRRLQEKHGRRLHCHIMTNLKRIGPVLEIMNPLGAKWAALKEYAARQSISQEEIVALGDDNNDIEMVMNSGLGIAMKNATERVKSAARAVTLHSNNEDGAAKSLAGVFGLGF